MIVVCMHERIIFGRTGQKVSPIGMGTYYDPKWIAAAKLFRKQSRSDSIIRAIKVGIDHGLNLIDTAELYGSENLVGSAIRDYERDELFIATKVWPTHFGYDKVIRSCNRSLKNLGVHKIDLYQLHFPSHFKDISETMKAMEALVDQGKIGHIGISNFSLSQTKEAVESMKKYEIASTQMHFSVAHRDIEEDLLPYCRDNGMAILAYYPLGHGKLVSASAFGTKTIEQISSNHEGKTAPQIALNWFHSKYDFVFPIPRASNPEHVVENAGSVGWKMTRAEIELLERTFE